MKVKPKEVMVNLPVVLTFTHEGEDVALASGFNTFLHGKVKLKYETLGKLNDQYVSIFYLQRNNEYHDLRREFIDMIEQEEMRIEQPTTSTTIAYADMLKDPQPAEKVSYAEIRASGILVNDEGYYCRQVPECGCGLCRDSYGGWKP